MDQDVLIPFTLFFDSVPVSVQEIDTSRGDSDFRVTFIVQTRSGDKHVLKLADNDFSFPEKIAVWQRTVDEYRSLGYYCPRIFRDRDGRFPVIDFRGHKFAVYAEEFAAFRPAEERSSENFGENTELYDSYKHDIWKMTARIAAKYFDYTRYPSAYCLFDTFCPSDKTDEVLENALAWKEYADTLPGAFHDQIERIWRLWTENRTALEKVYGNLPASVFQANLNPSNMTGAEDLSGSMISISAAEMCFSITLYGKTAASPVFATL